MHAALKTVKLTIKHCDEKIHIPSGGDGVLSTTVYCAVKECLESKPVLLPCNVTLR